MNISYSTEIRYIESWSRKNEEGENKQTKNIKSHSHFVICTHAAGEIALVVKKEGVQYEGNMRGKLILRCPHFQVGATFWSDSSFPLSQMETGDTVTCDIQETRY